MRKTARIHLVLCTAAFITILLLTNNMGYAQLGVELLTEPNIRTISLETPQKIIIVARPSQDNVRFAWELKGPGELSKEKINPWIFYIPPESISEKSAQATVTVMVTTPEEKTATAFITFILQALQPTTALLTVRSNVYDDTVFINGKKYGSTRFDQELPLGRYSIRVEKDGCTPYEEIIDLQEDIIVRAKLACATPTPEPSRLRSQPLNVSSDEVKKVFGLDENRGPRKYIKNDFGDRDEVVVDHATGLIWQKSGSERPLTYKEAQEYIEELNLQRFAGYENWRLPTVEELMSLLDPKKLSSKLYINPIFDKRQSRCWSSDKRSSESAWVVSFYVGYVSWNYFLTEVYVRAVRSGQ